MSDARTYGFSDSQRPGLVLGLSSRQAIPLATGVLLFAASLQTRIPPLVGMVGPVIGTTIAFGRWRGAPLIETLIPGTRHGLKRVRRQRRWVRSPLLGDNTDTALPGVLKGLELTEVPPAAGGGRRSVAVVRDRKAGTITATLRIHGHGFPLASAREQDTMLAAWSAALSPFARERSAVSAVTWQEWAHPVTSAAHSDFLDAVGIRGRRTDSGAVDYLALIEQQPRSRLPTTCWSPSL